MFERGYRASRQGVTIAGTAEGFLELQVNDASFGLGVADAGNALQCGDGRRLQHVEPGTATVVELKEASVEQGSVYQAPMSSATNADDINQHQARDFPSRRRSQR